METIKETVRSSKFSSYKTRLMNLRIFLLAFVSFSTVFAQKSDEFNDSNITTRTNLALSKIQVIPINDSRTKRQYELYIKLPDGYSENNETNYPVLYFTDAMWHIEILSGTSEYLIENMILVGISWKKDERAEISRYRDYTIIKSVNPKYQSGGAQNHLTFIQNDVIKYVEENYRTRPDNRTYFGYSLGGKFGAYILLTQPSTFKNYILGSPETLLDDSFIYNYDFNSIPKIHDVETNVFISTGELEREDLIEQAKGLVAMINKHKHKNSSLKYEIIKSADHVKAFPMAAVKSMYWLADFNKEN